MKTKVEMRIPLFRPSYGEEEIEAVRDCLQRGWTGTGPKVREFEERFADYIGVQYAVATNSCTGSLHLALKVVDVAGKEVITTPLTFVSTNAAILYNEGKPVFADILPDTLNIDPESVAERITKKTKAIVAMHYGGYSCKMEFLRKLAEQYGLVLVEDAAHACGGQYGERKLGSIGEFGCFSFHAVKNLATGDGGMVTTNNKEAYERMLKLRWLGISKETWARLSADNGMYSWAYDVQELGYRYGMNDITAAIGIAQLEKLDRLNERRYEISCRYNEGFRDLEGLTTPLVERHSGSSCHNYVIKVENRDLLCEFLAERGISSGVHYIPNYYFPIFCFGQNRPPVCERVWKKILTLPLYPDLKDSEIDYIVQIVRDFFKRENEKGLKSSRENTL